jgi:hypothetical protein
MNPATQTPPRRKWHFTRWAIVVIACIFAWSGWEVYAFRSALEKAKALGWNVHYVAPFESIQRNWKNAFYKYTWISLVSIYDIQTSDEFEQNIATIRRLNPRALTFSKASTLPNPALLNSLPALESIVLEQMELNQRTFDILAQVHGLNHLALRNCHGIPPENAFEHFKNLPSLAFYGCPHITNLDPLKNLTKLQCIWAMDCQNLTDVSALTNVTSLKLANFTTSLSLTQKAIDTLKAALPNAKITP